MMLDQSICDTLATSSLAEEPDRMKRPPRSLLTGLILLLASACAGAPQGALPPPPDEGFIPLPVGEEAVVTWQRPPQPESNASFLSIDGVPYYRLGPGDVLELGIGVAGGEHLYTLVVSEGGEVSLPTDLSGGRVRIGGLALPQAESRLTEALSDFLRDPRARLRVTEYAASPVALLGEIAVRGNDADSGPGAYPLEGPTRLSEFLFAHCTFTEDSDLNAVLVTDASGRTGMFDLNAVLYQADASHNPLLDRGDVVTVVDRASTQRHVYVLGEVTSPGLLRPRPGMCLVDAIALAGGPNNRARQSWVLVVRGRGEDAVLYKVPYADILRKGDLSSNMRLEPGDIVYVSRSSMDSVSQFFRDVWGILQTGVVFSIIVDRYNP